MQFEQLGPYKIGKRLGRGGMGAVFEGVNVDTGQAAAIKILNPHLNDDQGFRERFEMEIETLKKLKHPNIVRMLGYGEQDGHLYYAMELVKGHSVEEELALGRRFTWREVVQHAVKLCKALRHAHDHGVIHRDLKPANLLLTEADNEIKLTDFGIARLFGNNRLTMDGALVGTAEYMSPEQAAGERVTPQSDLYSLGGVMYAMLAGRPPFRSTSLPEMLHKQRFEQPPPLSRFVTGIPPELDDFVARLLSKDPQARAPNALVLSRQLAAMEHGLSIIRQRPAEAGATNIGDNLPIPADKTISNRDPSPDPALPTRAAAAKPPVFEHDPNASTLLAPSASVANQSDASPPTQISAVGRGMRDEGREAQSPDVAPPNDGKTAVHRSAADGDVSPSPPQPDPKSTVVQSRFTTVEEDRQRREETERHSDRSPAVVQIVLLTASLLMILGVGWYFTRPITVDRLFERIQRAANSDDSKALKDAEEDVKLFLNSFPDDPRIAKVKSYQEEIDLDRLELRFSLHMRMLPQDESPSPVEYDYMEAMNSMTTDPLRSQEKLQALVAFYGSSADKSEWTQQCIDLAKRQLLKLHDQAAKIIPMYQELINANLIRAERLKTSSPAQARTIWQSIVTLYGDKSWAVPQVTKAKAALLENGKSETADERR